MTPAARFIAEYGRYCQANDLTAPTLSESGVQAALSALASGKTGPFPFPYARRRDAEPKHIRDEA